MVFPARLLGPGEEVVLDVRPHGWSLLGPVLMAALAVALAGVASAVAMPNPVGWALLILLAVALLHLISRYGRWRSTSLVVTTERLVYRRGIVVRTSREIPLDQLSDLSCRQSLLDRLIGAGDLVAESAGCDSGEIIPSLPRPGRIQRDIERVVASRRMARGTSLSLPEQLERLDELRRRGVLSDAEFVTTKARLLRGP